MLDCRSVWARSVFRLFNQLSLIAASSKLMLESSGLEEFGLLLMHMKGKANQQIIFLLGLFVFCVFASGSCDVTEPLLFFNSLTCFLSTI